MMDREPSSRGFWRRNEIAGRRLMLVDPSQALDPEDLECIRANRAELARLEERERAVRARYDRLRGRASTLKEPSAGPLL